MSLDITYFSFSEPRADKQWADIDLIKKRFPDSELIENYLKQRTGGIFSKDTLELIKNVYDFQDEEGDDYFSLIQLDLYFGAVKNSDDGFTRMIPDIHEAFFGKEADVELSRDQLMQIFENISSEKKREIEDYLVKKTELNLLECQELLMDYLRAMHPVAKDLKETKDAILITFVNGEYYPSEAKMLLKERAEKHRF